MCIVCTYMCNIYALTSDVMMIMMSLLCLQNTSWKNEVTILLKYNGILLKLQNINLLPLPHKHT